MLYAKVVLGLPVDGEFDYLLNADENLDLLQQRFIVFELDNIKDHPILFPVVTIIIMEVFISKMRKLKGIRKMILIEEAWKAIAKEGMAEYIANSPQTPQGEMFVKDALLNSRLYRLDEIWRIEGSYMMYKQGEAILN